MNALNVLLNASAILLHIKKVGDNSYSVLVVFAADAGRQEQEFSHLPFLRVETLFESLKTATETLGVPFRVTYEDGQRSLPEFKKLRTGR
uniref:Uncharacterized protein n=1 Tax=viral metagenome TaxID=1070528 RepID=A0A2V0RA57_9ZZZZ